MRISPRTLLTVAMPALVLANVGRIPSAALGGRTAPLTLNDLLLVPLWTMLLALWLRRGTALRLDPVTRATLAIDFDSQCSLSKLTANDDCVRDLTRKSPLQASLQVGQRQFHWGKPPPAAEPKTRIFIRKSDYASRTGDARDQNSADS